MKHNRRAIPAVWQTGTIAKCRNTVCQDYTGYMVRRIRLTRASLFRKRACRFLRRDTSDILASDMSGPTCHTRFTLDPKIMPSHRRRKRSNVSVHLGAEITDSLEQMLVTYVLVFSAIYRLHGMHRCSISLDLWWPSSSSSKSGDYLLHSAILSTAASSVNP